MPSKNNTPIQINTLVIHTGHALSGVEASFFNALKYTFQCFQGMSKDNNFIMRLAGNNFLIGCHMTGRVPDPLVFVNEKGDILFEVNAEIFNSAIKEFNGYITYYTEKDPGVLYEEAVRLAIRDYKNDKLDFYANNKIAVKDLVNKAREQYQKQVEEAQEHVERLIDQFNRVLPKNGFHITEVTSKNHIIVEPDKQYDDCNYSLELKEENSKLIGRLRINGEIVSKKQRDDLEQHHGKILNDIYDILDAIKGISVSKDKEINIGDN